MILNVYEYETKYRNVRYTTFPPLLEKMYVIMNETNDENWINTQVGYKPEVYYWEWIQTWGTSTEV